MTTTASVELEYETATIAKALGHPARVQIIRLLLARDACYCGQLVDELGLAQATVSQHLKMLKEAGLIVGEIEGLRTCYWASRDGSSDCASCSGSSSTRPRRSGPMAATETLSQPRVR